MNKKNFTSANHHERIYKLYNGSLFAENIFGHAEAEPEWTEDRALAYEQFVHTQSYEIFKKRHNLFIFGRRGTGKTAIIKTLDHEIKNKLIKDYNYSKIINQEDTFYQLTLELRTYANSNSSSELTHILKEKLNWVIFVSAMIAVTEKEFPNDSTNLNLLKIRKYLEENNLVKYENRIITKSPFKHVLDVISKNFAIANTDGALNGIAILNSIRQLLVPDYDDSLNCLVNYLVGKNKSCVILIDSQELYDFKDAISECAISALMDSVLFVYNKSTEYKIYAKVAFPSEIFTHIKPSNAGKTNDKVHFIFWRYKDLLHLITKRYQRLLYSNNLIEEQVVLDSDKDCYNFIHKYLPQTTLSFGNIPFSTLPYIISHTQKRPREIILLFNIILSLAIDNKIPLTNITSDCIREGTNCKIEELSMAVLDMYDKIFPNASKIIKKTFYNSKNIITFGDLYKGMKEAKSILKPNNTVEKVDAERLFLESGIIGIKKSERSLKELSKNLIEAVFEYQIKGTITLLSNHQIIIHPMFYQELNIQVDQESIVYPQPSEEETEEIALVRNGVN